MAYARSMAVCREPQRLGRARVFRLVVGAPGDLSSDLPQGRVVRANLAQPGRATAQEELKMLLCSLRITMWVSSNARDPHFI